VVRSFSLMKFSNLWIIFIALLVLQARQNLSYLQKDPDLSLCSQLSNCSNNNTFQQSFILFLFHTDLIRFGLFAIRYFISSLFFSWLLLNFSTVLVMRSFEWLLSIVLYYHVKIWGNDFLLFLFILRKIYTMFWCLSERLFID